MQPAEEREHLTADQAALRIGIARVQPVAKPGGGAIRLRLAAPYVEQRVNDAVVPLRSHPGRSPARDEPVQDRLHLVGGGVARRAETVAGDREALVAQLRLGGAPPVELDHLGAEYVHTEARVLVRLRAAQLVVHVHRTDAVAERAERVPEAGRVRAAGDETAHLSPRLDQVVSADERFDSLEHQKMSERYEMVRRIPTFS